MRMLVAARPWAHSDVMLAAVAGLWLFVLRGTAAEPARGQVDPAAAVVSEALQREIYGLGKDRSELLAAAIEISPDYAPAMWQSGYLRDAKLGWLKPEEYLHDEARASRLSAYESQRSSADDTLEANLRLADWCARAGMSDQERAHLMRMIDLSPDHAVARQRLGFVRIGGNWISRDEITRERERDAARRAAEIKWRPALQEIRAGLEHRSQQRREFALGKLQQLVSADVIPAIETVFADAAGEAMAAALDALVSITDPQASLTLARFAVLARDPAVREAAAVRLRERDLDSFVPQLVASLYSPVTSRFAVLVLPNGRIGYRHAFVREGQDKQEMVVLDTEYRRIAQVGGDRENSAFRAFADAGARAQARERAAALQNEWTRQSNERLVSALNLATGQELTAKPEAWWQWWNERNEVFVAAEKPTSSLYDQQRVTVVDRAPTAVASLGSGAASGAASAPSDCLVAGTLIWTARGPVEVELIRVGDLVLSQHTETGELAMKPVLKTTIRPTGPLIKIEAGGETISSSGGHPFWVAGEGWKKARELKSGQVLHSPAGPVHLSTVERSGEATTYNLVVADFNTYFIGYKRILSHDNTPRRATRALVPGLLQD